MNPPVIRFAEFELDLNRYELRQAGRRVDLQRVPMDLLILLAEREGALVTRHDIVARLWGPDALTDTERSINTAIRKVRQALGDDAASPRFVETVVGKGYRFIVPVSSAAPDLTPGSPPKIEASGTGGGPTWRGAAKWFFAAVAALAALTLVWPRRDGLPPMRITPFTALHGVEANPAFSPDGAQVAFCLSQSDGSQHLYRKAVGVGSPEQLTAGPGRDSNPSWSRDGQTIAFLRETGGTMFLYVMRVPGGPEREVAALSKPREHRPSWAADGKSLAIVDSPPGEAQGSIFLLSIESGQKRRLIAPAQAGTGDWHPVYSPDGRWLAFVRNIGSAQSALLYEVPVDPTGAARGAERLIPAGRPALRSIAWSADGRSFVCETQAGLVRIPRSGGALQQLAFPDATEPSVALAGNRLVYVRSRRDVDIFSIPGPGTAGAPVDVISSSRMDGAPSYSPDGRRIAFISDRTGSTEIWVSDSKGEHATQLTTSGGDLVGCPRWSPDGQSIAFDSTSTAGTHIVLVRANGGAARPITTGNSQTVRPSWSRDGKWIYFGSNRSGRWEIWKTKPNGTGSVQVTRNGGREAFEDAEGRFLYYSMEPPASGIWRIPVSGGVEEMVTNQGLQGRWALGERGLYYLRGENELERLALTDRSTLTIATVGLQMAAGTGGLLSVSPGERSILVTASMRREGELMMVDGFR